MEGVSIYIHKSHNVTVLIYHLVFPTKYCQLTISQEVDKKLKDICLEIQKRYELHFVEIGTDQDHVHFLLQSVPPHSVTKLVTMIKSITARKLLESIPQLKQELWGAAFWSSGFYASTVGKQGNEQTISRYVKEQGREKEYTQIHLSQILIDK